MRVVDSEAAEAVDDHEGLSVTTAAGITLRIHVVEEDVFRVSLTRQDESDQSMPPPPSNISKTWMVAPGGGGADGAPYDGRPKFAKGGLAMPKFTTDRSVAGKVTLSTSRLRLTIDLTKSPLHLVWEWHDVAGGGKWRPLFSDRRTGAYYFGRRDERIAHHIARRRGDRFYGLGEKSGALDRSGRRYRMDCLDAMGYDAEKSDPLYKFWPFYIAKPALSAAELSAGMATTAAYGIFYDNLSSCTFDLGCAFDNYHGLFTSYEATCGELDYYVMLGPQIAQVTRRFAWLCGGHCLPPVWSLGYSGSTMTYTDAPNAQERMQSFVELCQKHSVPCSSFQMSSGYTSIGTKRYVFHWNRDKFPNPAAFAQSYSEAGLHLAANIKPCLLTDHPLYEACEAAGLFIRDSESDEAVPIKERVRGTPRRPTAANRSNAASPRASSSSSSTTTTNGGNNSSSSNGNGNSSNKPETSMFWDAVGSHLDFTNPSTAAWWRDQVSEKLLKNGICSTWNDNNEWHVEDEGALCHGFGEPTPLRYLRPLHALLMVRCSYEAQAAHEPTRRQWLISRSGMPGTQRYAQTWSGDNYTSWHTLKYNIQMGLGLSLSGFYNAGHDVGGFAGPAPSPELLVRWVQNGCFHPRFTIHSWNTDLEGTPDGTCNEPWMFPEVLPMVREAIELRYSLVPYMYHHLRRAVDVHEPMLRPIFLDYEDDVKAWEPSDDFMLGDALLVASVVEPGQRTRRVYLPDNKGKGWWDWHTGEWLEGGQALEAAAPLDRCPLFVAGGSMVPLAEAAKTAATPASTTRRLKLFPPSPSAPPSTVELTWVEDDGETDEGKAGTADKLVISCVLECLPTELKLEVSMTGYGKCEWRRWSCVKLELPKGEARLLSVRTEQGGSDEQGRVAVLLVAPQ